MTQMSELSLRNSKISMMKGLEENDDNKYEQMMNFST